MLFLLLLSTIVVKTAFAQKSDTTWYNSKWEKTDKLIMVYYRISNRDSIKNHHFVRDYYASGQIQMEGYYTSLNPEIRNGQFKWWFENGNKQREILYKENTVFKIIEWDVYGKIINQHELVNTVTYHNGEPVYELKSIDVPPAFKNGNSALYSFISNNLHFPADAAKLGVEGKVIVRFVVNAKGKVVDPEIVRSVYPSLDREALRVIKLMPNWIPGIQGGKYVKVMYSLTINFQR